MFQIQDIILIVIVLTGLIAVGLFFLNRWISKRSVEQQSMIEKSKMPATIYVIDKRHDKPENVTLPKVVMDNFPKVYKFMKAYFIKSKIGPQIVTLMCDKKVYNMLTVKKTYKIELAGMYIVGVKGMKSEYEMKQAAKNKKEQEKANKKREKVLAREAKKK